MPATRTNAESSMDTTSATDTLLPSLPRGVYMSHIRAEDGRAVMFAVDSQGRTIGEVRIDRLTTRDKAARLLWVKLNRVDPAAKSINSPSSRVS
jgi:hypothetical protein